MIGSQRSSSRGQQLVAAKRFCLGEAPRQVQSVRETGAVDDGAFVRDLRRVVPSRSPPRASRGGAAATTWRFRGGLPPRRVAATPRPRRRDSVEAETSARPVVRHPWPRAWRRSLDRSRARRRDFQTCSDTRPDSLGHKDSLFVVLPPMASHQRQIGLDHGERFFWL